MRILSLAAASALLFSSAGISQNLIVMPPHSTTYNGFSRGYSFTAQSGFFINTLDLPADAKQSGDTAAYLVVINGTQVYHSTGNAGAVSVNIQVQSGDIVRIVGNWSPAAPGQFTAHNSYASGGGTYATAVEGVSTTLFRAGQQWDVGDPTFGGTGFEGLTGSMGRVDVYTNPPSGLFAGFTSDVQTGPSPLTVNFQDNSFSSDPGGITAWAWDFENDGTIDSTVQNPTFTYANCGVYDVSLTVFDATHPPSTKVETAYITTDTTSADFSYGLIAPLAVQFTDTSTGNPTSWDWDLDGDGVTDATVQNPAWVYANTNPVTVTLTVSRLCGPTSTISQTIVPLQQITTTFAANNGGAVGWTQYFDMDVTNAFGLEVGALDIHANIANTPFTLEVYLTSGTYAGKEQSPEEWALVGSGSGTSNATAGQPSSVTLAAPFYMPSGSYGVAIHYATGVGPRYTNGNGSNQTYSNADVTLNLGISRSTTTGNPFGAGTTFNPRVWNGTIYYGTHNITGEAGYGFFGAGCAGSMGMSTLTPSGDPIFGSTLTVTIDNLPQSAAIMMTGFSKTTSILGPLPFDLSSFGAPGCVLRVSPDANQFLLGAGNTATWTLNVPNTPSLAGTQMFQQAVVLDPGFNAAGAVGSNAAGMIIGN